MVNTGLIWILCQSLFSIFAVTAFVLHYIQAGEADYIALGIGVVFGGGVIEIAVANGYLPESGLADIIVILCVVVGVLAAVVGMKRQRKPFQILRSGTR